MLEAYCTVYKRFCFFVLPHLFRINIENVCVNKNSCLYMMQWSNCSKHNTNQHFCWYIIIKSSNLYQFLTLLMLNKTILESQPFPPNANQCLLTVLAVYNKNKIMLYIIFIKPYQLFLLVAQLMTQMTSFLLTFRFSVNLLFPNCFSWKWKT